MSYYGIVTAACAALVMCACGKKPAEQPAASPAGQPDAATQVGVSTDSALGSALNAPGDYVHGMQSNVEKAEKAAAVYGKAIEAHDAGNTEGGE
jgi:hypothetical protein